MTSTRDDRHLIRISLYNRRLTALLDKSKFCRPMVQKFPSSQLIKRRLREVELFGCIDNNIYDK